VNLLPETCCASPQFLYGMKPVFFRRALRTASRLPQRMSQGCDVLVPKSRFAMGLHSVPVCLLGFLVSLLGVLESSPRAFLPGLVILFLMGFRSTTMGVGGSIVQFSGSLMVFVM
jgi:hypothetical protein